MYKLTTPGNVDLLLSERLYLFELCLSQLKGLFQTFFFFVCLFVCFKFPTGELVVLSQDGSCEFV